ncbi:MAG TPA: dihydropteroate synthase [Deinococcales bacterium]|nr:dihydropteroate synthase [Deinococcales bacterium]
MRPAPELPFPLPRGAVMGILNVTPDSFSDGGRWADGQAAIERAREMVAQGAAIVDVGGESTRPRAQAVPPDVEAERVLRVIAALRGLDAIVSVDTRHAAVAREAVRAGAQLVNDVTGLQDPEMRLVCAELGVPGVLMHNRADPATMDYSGEAAPFVDVVAEVRDELAAAAEVALRDGVPGLLLDPGFGFGKSMAQNLRLVRRLDEIAALGFPVVLGASRKSTVGRAAGVDDPERRDAASLAVHLYGLARGATVLRAHDVAGHVQGVRAWLAVERA